jgi:hypothetical protein
MEGVRRLRRGLVTGAGTLLALLAFGWAQAGCTSGQPVEPPRAPVPAPRVAVRVRYQLGGPLHGPIAPGKKLPADALTPGHALSLEVAIVALAAPPQLGLAPVASQSRVALAEGPAGDTIRATPRVLEDAQAGLVDGTTAALLERCVGDRAGRGTEVDLVRACLVAGATTVIELVRDEPPSRVGVPRRERAAILLGRRVDGSGVDVAIEHEGEPGPPELVELAATLFTPGAGATWAALLPSPFEGDEARWIGFIVHASAPQVSPTAGAAEHEEVVAAAARDIVAQEQTAKVAVALVAPPPDVPSIDATRKALADRTTARQGLYSLGVATHARTAEALAVGADDATLAPIASAVAAALGSATPTGKPDELGLVVEKATLAECVKALGREPVPADVLAALELRGGAALKLLPSLAPEIDKARTLAELESIVLGLNVRLLLDASPAVRARAARWLGARVPLHGYSPIASSADRRAAVEKIKRHESEAHGESR